MVVPGHRDKYALVERERRFLLAAPPSGVRLTDERQITDRYLTGTRLRLRRVTRAGCELADESGSGVVKSDPDPPSSGRRPAAPAEPELKLTQKAPAACPPPAGSVAEVTSDERFTGGRLAVTPRAELLAWLATYGLTVQDDAGASDPARAALPQ